MTHLWSHYHLRPGTKRPIKIHIYNFLPAFISHPKGKRISSPESSGTVPINSHSSTNNLAPWAFVLQNGSPFFPNGVCKHSSHSIFPPLFSFNYIIQLLAITGFGLVSYGILMVSPSNSGNYGVLLIPIGELNISLQLMAVVKIGSGTLSTI